MSEINSKNICEVEILPELFDAARAIAALNNIPVEAVINRAILSDFRNEHNALIDFHHDCGCGPETEVCEDMNYEIGRFNIIRKKLRPYETGLKCICCGEDITPGPMANTTIH